MKKKQQKKNSWDSSLEEVSLLSELADARPVVCGGGRTWWVSDVKVSIERNCASLLMSKNLKLKKVIKSFVPEPISCFFGFPMYISRVRIYLDVNILQISLLLFYFTFNITSFLACFFRSALVDGLSLLTVGRQITSGLQDSAEYFSWSQQCFRFDSLNSSSYFFILFLKSFGTLPSMPSTISITVTSMFQLFFSAIWQDPQISFHFHLSFRGSLEQQNSRDYILFNFLVN